MTGRSTRAILLPLGLTKTKFKGTPPQQPTAVGSESPNGMSPSITDASSFFFFKAVESAKGRFTLELVASFDALNLSG